MPIGGKSIRTAQGPGYTPRLTGGALGVTAPDQAPPAQPVREEASTSIGSGTVVVPNDSARHQVVGPSANRRSVLIVNQGTETVRIGGSDVGASSGRLLAGAAVEVATAGEVWAWVPSTAAAAGELDHFSEFA